MSRTTEERARQERTEALRQNLDFNHPYVIQAAGWWLGMFKGSRQSSWRRRSQWATRVEHAAKLRTRRFMKKAIACLSVAANSSCTMPTATR